MRGVRVIIIKCVGCQHYAEDGICRRCNYDENTYQNWLGMAYIEHPTVKNRKGDCEDYEEIN